MKISKIQYHKMLHALGYSKLRRNWKALTLLNKAYRNRFVLYVKDSTWEELVKNDLAGLQTQKHMGKDLHYYYVKEKGIEAMIRFLEQ